MVMLTGILSGDTVEGPHLPQKAAYYMQPSQERGSHYLFMFQIPLNCPSETMIIVGLKLRKKEEIVYFAHPAHSA